MSKMCVLHAHFAKKCKGKNDEKWSHVVLKNLEKISRYFT